MRETCTLNQSLCTKSISSLYLVVHVWTADLKNINILKLLKLKERTRSRSLCFWFPFYSLKERITLTAECRVLNIVDQYKHLKSRLLKQVIPLPKWFSNLFLNLEALEKSFDIQDLKFLHKASFSASTIK